MSFVKLWDDEVKQLAVACVTDQRLVSLMMKNENQITEDDKNYAKSVSGKYKDIYRMYYISEMIWKIEHALADNRQEQAKMVANSIYSGISQNLLVKVFNNDETNEEWALRANLKKGLGKMLEIENEKNR